MVKLLATCDKDGTIVLHLEEPRKSLERWVCSQEGACPVLPRDCLTKSLKDLTWDSNPLPVRVQAIGERRKKGERRG